MDTRSAGRFSSNPQTWLPVAADYKILNVQTESTPPDSLLAWNEALIALRRSNAALHDGGMVMLDAGDPDVLAYLRTPAAGDAAVVVLMNRSDSAKTVSVGGHPQSPDGAVRTLATSVAALRAVHSLSSMRLPPYSCWIGSVPGGASNSDTQ